MQSTILVSTRNSTTPHPHQDRASEECQKTKFLNLCFLHHLCRFVQGIYYKLSTNDKLCEKTSVPLFTQ